MGNWGNSHRFTPVHELVQLEESLCKVFPVLHTLTGCDYTNKFGTKSTALKTSPSTFQGFGTMEIDIGKKIQLAEKYFVIAHSYIRPN